MKGKAAITDGLPLPVMQTLDSAEFAQQVLVEVAENCLGAKKVLDNPAEFYVQKTDITINTGKLGVEVRLTGVSRGTRRTDQFERALETLHHLYRNAIVDGLSAAHSTDVVQLFVVIMVDNEVPIMTEAHPVYSNVLEHESVWLSAEGEVEQPQS